MIKLSIHSCTFLLDDDDCDGEYDDDDDDDDGAGAKSSSCWNLGRSSQHHSVGLR